MKVSVDDGRIDLKKVEEARFEIKNTPTCAVWNVLWEPGFEVETSRPDIWITTTDPSRRGAVGLQHQSN